VAEKARLSNRQKRRAERIAREKGLACPDCGSSEPVPEGEALSRAGGGAEISMRCPDCESASEVALVLSPEEAEALGLGRALRDPPGAREPPR
jgi:DNA-directed RNA polymerase subunit RPC12/RpoP